VRGNELFDILGTEAAILAIPDPHAAENSIFCPAPKRDFGDAQHGRSLRQVEQAAPSGRAHPFRPGGFSTFCAIAGHDWFLATTRA
jgi:hypothetical protein